MKRAPHSPQYEGTKCVSAVDWLGNRFRLGEQVMYCIGAGRGQMMAIGEVVALKVDGKHYSEVVECDPDHPDSNGAWAARGTGWRYQRHPYDSIAVQVRTLKTSGRWDNTERGKPAWVNAMNITALKPVETP